MRMKAYVVAAILAAGALVHAAPTPATGSIILDQTDVRAAGQLSFHGAVQNVPAQRGMTVLVYVDCDDPFGNEVVNDWYVVSPYWGPGTYSYSWSVTTAYFPKPALTCTASLIDDKIQDTRFYQDERPTKSNTLATVNFAIAAAQ